MPPNALVVVIDALRADRVNAVGGRELTPHIDKLAEDGVVFTNAHTTINATDPAVTSLHTGRYPLSQGLIHHSKDITDKEKKAIETVPSLPEVLSAEGYRTGWFGRLLGRWHRNGFDSYPEPSRPSKSTKARIDRVLRRIDPRLRDVISALYNGHSPIGNSSGQQGEETNGNASSTDTISSESTDEVVENLASFVDGTTPFYSYIHLNNTHIPYDADPDVVRSCFDKFEYETQSFFENKYISKSVIPDSYHELIEAGEYPEIAQYYYYTDQVPSSAVSDAHYDATVIEADNRIGKMISLLKERNLYDDTLIFVLSDHGESLTEHGIYYDHHGLYDVSTHIPLVVKPPGGTTGVIDEGVQIMDIAPTIAAYTGAEGLEPDGYSLRPTIEKEDSIGRDHMLAEEANATRRRMLRTENMKLIYRIGDRETCSICDVRHASDIELYDLSADPEERKNLIQSRSDEVARLKHLAEKQARNYMERSPDEYDKKDVSYDDEKEVYKQMEALGYR